LFEEAGFPPGVINLVHGEAETGEALVRNPGVNVVLFTGSYDVGHRIQQLSTEHFDRIVACEMGSKSAVIVCEDAKLDLAVTCGIVSAFKTSGQRCVSAGRILVAEKLFDRFAERFVDFVNKCGLVSSPRPCFCNHCFDGTGTSPDLINQSEAFFTREIFRDGKDLKRRFSRSLINFQITKRLCATHNHSRFTDHYSLLPHGTGSPAKIRSTIVSLVTDSASAS